MKSVKIPPPNSPIVYPCIMHSNLTTVLFSKAGVGTVIATNDTYNYPLSYYSDNWVMGNFSLFNGTIELSN